MDDLDNVGDDQGGGEDLSKGNSGGGEDLSKAKTITLTVQELNDRINGAQAKQRRTLKGQVDEARQQREAFNTLKNNVSELLQSGLLPEGTDFDNFTESTAKALDMLRTDKERLEATSANQAKELNDAKESQAQAIAKYETAVATRALQDAAADLQRNAGAGKMIVKEILADSVVKDDGTVMVKRMVKDPASGLDVEKLVTPQEAVKMLEANPTEYGFLFKSSVNGGDGGEIDGVRRTNDGGIDFADMSPEKFFELSIKAPDQLTAAIEKLGSN